MSWAKLHAELSTHPKVARLTRLLAIHPAQSVGHVVALWCWVLKYAQDGDLGDWEAEDMEGPALWTGEPGALIAALVKVRLLDCDADGRLSVHDWREYAGSWDEATKKREKRARDKAAQLASEASRGRVDDCPQTVPGQSPDSPPTVQRRRAEKRREEKREDHTSHRAGEPETAPEPDSPEGKPPDSKPDPLDLPSTMHAADVERALRQSGMDLEVMGVNRDRLSRLCPVQLSEYQAALNATLGQAASPCAAYLLRCIEGARSKPVPAPGGNGGQRAPPIPVMPPLVYRDDPGPSYPLPPDDWEARSAR